MLGQGGLVIYFNVYNLYFVTLSLKYEITVDKENTMFSFF